MDGPVLLIVAGVVILIGTAAVTVVFVAAIAHYATKVIREAKK